MMSRPLAFGILALLSSLACSAEIPARSAMCKSLRVAGLKQHDAAVILPERKLSKEEFKIIHKERLCLKSYSLSFPGGEEAFLEAGSAALLEDVEHFSDLFAKAEKIKLTDKHVAALNAAFAAARTNATSLPEGARDINRLYDIQHGLDRTQALLWGYSFYIRKLDDEKKYQQLLSEVEKLRSKFDLTVAPVKSWDDAEANTYFSAQTLRNLIGIYVYRARAKTVGGDIPKARQLTADFARDRDAFVQLFGMMRSDITETVRHPYCRITTAVK